jgi:hypothetical protein
LTISHEPSAESSTLSALPNLTASQLLSYVQPPTPNSQHTTYNIQNAAYVQPTTHNPQLTTYNLQHTKCSLCTTHNIQLTTHNIQHTIQQHTKCSGFSQGVQKFNPVDSLSRPPAETYELMSVPKPRIHFEFKFMHVPHERPIRSSSM